MLPSRAGVTFQVRPNPWLTKDSPEPADACDRTLPHTPHAGGMLVGLVDGSVKQLNPGIAPHIFWGAITPAGGEVLGDW